MGKMASRKVKKLVQQSIHVGFARGLQAAAEMKSISEVRKAASEAQSALETAQGVRDIRSATHVKEREA